MRLLSLAFLLFFGLQSLLAQEDYVISELQYTDYIYRDFVASCCFYPDDSEVDYPVVQLASPNKLILEFDDLDADNKDYNYKIIHCNRNWEPSEDIDALDYIDGFQENRFYESLSSFGTRTEYLHYQLELPNDDVKWTKSGNYLLLVYLNDDEEDLVLSRRFLVYEPQMNVEVTSRRSAIPPYGQTHQEFSCQLQHAGMNVSNPNQDVKLTVVQNWNWPQALKNLAPTFVEEEVIHFDRQGQIIFPGQREFRPLDIRSFRHRGPQVQNLARTNEGFELLLFPEKERKYSPYLFTNDLNGKFIIASYDAPNPEERGEYGQLFFQFKSPEYPNARIFVYGGFSDFQAYPQYELNYNTEKGQYEGILLFKNGFYDYGYGLLRDGEKQLDQEELEGNRFETENDYLFLVYYRPFGGRYDQLVAFQKASSTHR